MTRYCPITSHRIPRRRLGHQASTTTSFHFHQFLQSGVDFSVSDPSLRYATSLVSMNIQRSNPIPIQNGRKPYAHFDTPPNLASSGSLSPNLSAPSPPNFVPKEPDAISKVGRYLLLNETQLNVYKTLDSITQDELVCKVRSSFNFFFMYYDVNTAAFCVFRFSLQILGASYYYEMS